MDPKIIHDAIVLLKSGRFTLSGQEIEQVYVPVLNALLLELAKHNGDQDVPATDQ